MKNLLIIIAFFVSLAASAQSGSVLSVEAGYNQRLSLGYFEGSDDCRFSISFFAQNNSLSWATGEGHIGNSFGENLTVGLEAGFQTERWYYSLMSIDHNLVTDDTVLSVGAFMKLWQSKGYSPARVEFGMRISFLGIMPGVRASIPLYTGEPGSGCLRL